MFRVVTNNIARDIVDGRGVPERERAQFPYLDWGKVDAGEVSVSFVRFYGRLFDLAKATRPDHLPSLLTEWDGMYTEGPASAVLVRFVTDGEVRRVVAGRVFFR